MTDLNSGMKVADTILDTIGNTPLVRLQRVGRGAGAQVLAKVEYFNPGGSVKDRIGIRMIENEIEKGTLKPGGTIVECTSGNTGVGLALAASVMGFKAIFTMPDKMSKEKVRLLKAYGAEVITCPTAVPPDHPESYYSVARRIVDSTPNAVLANQYFNPVNPQTHYETTGPEIWRDTGGRIDCFVGGMGTGGTVSGIGRYLKEQNPDVMVVGVDPEGSILRHYFETKEKTEAHPYLIEGIGEDIVPDTCQFEYVDRMMSVTDKESFQYARRLSREEGLMVGGSAGSAVAAAIEVARELDEGKVVVVLLPDTGERYLSKVHSDEWLHENRMLDVHRLTVGDLLQTKRPGPEPVVTVGSGETVQDALERMRQTDLSQLAVRDGESWVGRVVEVDLLDRLFTGKVPADSLVSRVMGGPFPIVNAEEPYDTALQPLFKSDSAVLVDDGSGVIGILTRYDVVDYVLTDAG